MKIHFFGAAQNVTGSCYMLEAGGGRVLVDCGFYQERALKKRNWDAFPFEPGSIDAVLLTHAHLDHCGLLPKLVKHGFSGRIHCTPATADIAGIVLLDSAKIQEEDAAYKKKRHEREGRRSVYPEMPLYGGEDAEKALGYFLPVRLGEELKVWDSLSVSFHEAGHILGSSMIRLAVKEGGVEKTVVFSGDVGRWGAPIIRDPGVFDETDYVVVESTYGNRTHEEAAAISESLGSVVNETCKAGGKVVIPSFAIERTQELLYRLGNLLAEGRIPRVKVFVDSPMAIRVTEVFVRHPELFDEETLGLLREGRHPCDFPGLEMCRSVDESKAVNSFAGPAIVIAGSGMCTGGRIKHHLVNNIGRPECTILFVGYQAVGTLGRVILEGAERVRIFGKSREVKARVAKINGLSAHADREELLRWLTALKRGPDRVFVTHGEPSAADAFGELVGERTGWEVAVPAYLDEVAL